MQETKNKLVFNKGYTVRCKSWENDADDFRTNDLTVPSLEMAIELKELCLLCRSKNRDKSCVGNTYDKYTPQQVETICDFVKDHKLLFPDVEETYDEHDYVKTFNKTQRIILGYSDDFVCRVCEKVEILYTDKDIYVQILE